MKRESGTGPRSAGRRLLNRQFAVRGSRAAKTDMRPQSAVRGSQAAWRAARDRISVASSGIEGWLSEAQGRALFEAAAAATGRGAIVEIGSWKGRSTAWLAAGAKLAGRRVYAIDRHSGAREDPAAHTLADFLHNIERAGVRHAVEPLVMSSAEAAVVVNGPVELLFVDGDHSYEGVKRDAEIWLPRIVEGGVVMFHDVATAGYDGPRRVFRSMVCWSDRFAGVRRIGSMVVARRTGRRTLGEAIWSTLAGVILYVFDAKQLVRSMTRRRNAT
jgi:predicted O-methyltransferase YrrM